MTYQSDLMVLYRMPGAGTRRILANCFLEWSRAVDPVEHVFLQICFWSSAPVRRCPAAGLSSFHANWRAHGRCLAGHADRRSPSPGRSPLTGADVRVAPLLLPRVFLSSPPASCRLLAEKSACPAGSMALLFCSVASVQRQTAATANFTSQQLLLFDFSRHILPAVCYCRLASIACSPAGVPPATPSGLSGAQWASCKFANLHTWKTP